MSGKRSLAFVALAALLAAGAASPFSDESIALPPPRHSGTLSVEAAMYQRSTLRNYAAEPLTLDEMGQLLWAAQGRSASGRRTAPSAGALYPLEVHALVGDVSGLSPGLYRYQPAEHRIALVTSDDLRKPLAAAAVAQNWIAEAPIVFVISAVYSRTEKKYGDRTHRYVHIEVGHAAQNLLLQAVALGLGGGEAGAFRDEELRRLLRLPADEAPLYILPVGKPRS